MTEKIAVGLTEKVKLVGKEQSEEYIARIDTGATKSSIDLALASRLQLGPITRSRMIKSAHGSKLRPVVEVTIEIQGKPMRAEFTLADRSHMRYRILIGQNILRNGFIIDPTKK
ncbi:MAG: RimK/LysX family protein [Candidatus Woesearchaeota archaeon]